MSGFVGSVVEPIDGERSRLFAGCFSLLDGEFFATAEHVVSTAFGRDSAERLYVMGPAFEPLPAEALFRHPAADLALLHVPHGRPVEPFREVGSAALGAAVSLPAWRSISQGSGLSTVSTTIAGGPHPLRTPKHQFDAVELAGEGPGNGFSGSPVVDDHGSVIGIYTTRFRASAEGRWRGFALSLPELLPWIEQTISEAAA